MRLLGKIELTGFPYYVILEDTKGSQKWFLYSEIHPKNYIKSGADRYKDSLTLDMLAKSSCQDYIVEAIQRSKKNGIVKVYKSRDRLNRIIKDFIDARDLHYPKPSIINDSEYFVPYKVKEFEANYNGFSIDYKKENDLFMYLSFSANGTSLSLQEMKGIKLPRSLDYVEIRDTKANTVMEVMSIDHISYENLQNIVDLSWYVDEDGKILKDYTSVCTLDDFESKVVTPIIRTIQRAQNEGRVELLSCDTETTGFRLVYLSDHNPDKDRISTIQFSWKYDQGVTVFLDMEHFDNIDKDYVIKRLGTLFTRKKSIIDFTLIRDENGNEINETVKINQKSYELTGHNTIFDSRVTLCEGCQYYFDHDTLQMAFNINPTTIRGSKGLKNLTRYFFKEETPELVDILGKGNEGKFRYLKDRRVAEIYGCADVDYARKLVGKLKSLMTEKMYRSYKKFDPDMWYFAARSEYYGMPLDENFIGVNSKIVQKDLNLIQELIYNYVGSVLSQRTKMVASGAFSSKESELKVDDSDMSLLEGSRYEFKLGGADVRRVMYSMLKYPVVARTTKGEPAVNKDSITKLLYHRNPSSSGILKKDLVSCNGKTVLIQAKKFNSYKYPLCYLLQEYSKWNKEYTTYYKPFEQEDLEGRLFKGISTTNIETRRISSPVQTIKKDLKKAVVAHSKDYYLADWDLNQVEARIFTSEAGDEKGILRLLDAEKDYHTENAALMNNILAHLVVKDQRKGAKATGFGIPYGLSDFKLCERLFTEVNEETRFKTAVIRKKFEVANQICMDYLNGIRSRAITPVEVPVELKHFWGLPSDAKVGMVYNKNGFYRYFPLDNVLGDPSAEASVARAAGNFPIQSFAADLFRLLISRFYDRLCEYGYEDKVIFHMYIHDEILFSVHKSIDPRIIAKICADACMLRLKGHTNYFIGLGFGKTWYEAKDDANELPTNYLKKISKELHTYTDIRDWTDDPMELMRPKVDQFKRQRFIEVVEGYMPNMNNTPINIQDLIDKFQNYTVRSYVYESKRAYIPRTIREYDGTEKVDDNDEFLSRMCTCFALEGLDSQLIETESGIYSIKDYVDKRHSMEIADSFEEIELLDEDDEDDEGDDEFWSFDDDDAGISHVINLFYNKDYDTDEIVIDQPKTLYDNIKAFGQGIKIKCSSRQIPEVSKFLESKKSFTGKRIIIETPVSNRTLPSKYNVNLDELDDFITKIKRGV